MSLNGMDPSVAACSPQDFATNPYVFKYSVCNYVLKKYASCDAKTDGKMLACIKPSKWQRLRDDIQ